ncbi:MAG TPA: ABC transporter permease [Gammaproteobacteria bacterium]|nr:ABC transporter permease [Gammaproteobacteria bacterium]
MLDSIKGSWSRFLAVVMKETLQICRDPAVIAMTILIPLMEVLLFSYAINTNPTHLPTYVLDQDQSQMSRQLVYGMNNTHYFDIHMYQKGMESAIKDLHTGKATFVVNIPRGFSKKIATHQSPKVLLLSDATDPVATRGAQAAMVQLSALALQSHPVKPTFELVSHEYFNPRAISRNYIVPGLLGVILVFSLCMMTTVSLVKEREIGSLEVLLATPLRPFEVITGKIAPFIVIGYIQVMVIVAVAYFLSIPFLGSLSLLLFCCLPFIVSNLSMGMLFSTISKNELQAVTSSVFFMLPSILLSGFIFPFKGMPVWAQWIGSVLPLTHFNRITKGIMLKGLGFGSIIEYLIPIIIFDMVVLIIASKVFNPTLD